MLQKNSTEYEFNFYSIFHFFQNLFFHKLIILPMPFLKGKHQEKKRNFENWDKFQNNRQFRLHIRRFHLRNINDIKVESKAKYAIINMKNVFFILSLLIEIKFEI